MAFLKSVFIRLRLLACLAFAARCCSKLSRIDALIVQWPRWYTDVGFPAVVRELSFLNTLDTAGPVAASQEEWAYCVLFLSSRTRCNPIATQLAYHRYEQFLRREASCTFVANAISQLLPVLGTYLRLQRLNPGRYRYKTIRHLCLNAVLAGKGLDDSIANFLGFCDIVGTWVPENELFGFTEHHPLNRLTLKQPNIVCEGILPSRDSEGYLIEDPFPDPNYNIPILSLLY
ncbi:hypothetical protein C8A01DRAFT_49576 [Parachaetomium inaequale]|uniref:Uncharacterized protein n=1 Tax=Parachaetomium inaequale TaxID=2588326 RepID=A0AAN6P911_9PEZI|nr:hypothetical protein C8A01DRAFT_49576 [Parachaetomium inaequale]